MWASISSLAKKQEDVSALKTKKCSHILTAYKAGHQCGLLPAYVNTQTGEVLCGKHFKLVDKTPGDPVQPCEAKRRESSKRHLLKQLLKHTIEEHKQTSALAEQKAALAVSVREEADALNQEALRLGAEISKLRSQLETLRK